MRVGQVRKRDGIEREIIDALEATGRTVVQHGGKGEPDLFVEFALGLYVGLEVKKPGGKLTPEQKKFKGPCYVVHSVEEALVIFGIGRGHV